MKILTFLFVSMALLAGALGGCHPSTQQVKPPSTDPISFSPEVQDHLRRAERIGREIYDKDRVAAQATDAVRTEGIDLQARGSRGWITNQQDHHWLVRFVGEEEDRDVVIHEVTLPLGSAGKAEVSTPDPPASLSPTQLAMYTARKVAFQTASQRCPTPYNSVVLPAELIGASGWVVYLLAATTRADEIMAGGHIRIELSEDGMQVRRVTPLSKTCLRIPLPEVGMDSSAMITHLGSDTPMETHVFLSLLHRKTIYVGTSLGVWKVTEGRIAFLGK